MSDESIQERSLRESWSIGPLRPWLKVLADRQLPSALKGKVDASDIVQQTFIDAWRGRDQFRGTTHAERLAWLRVILTRVILRSDRDRKAAKRGAGREKQLQAAIDQTSTCLERLAVGDGPGPASIAEQVLRLAEALDRLPDDYRRVLVLRHLENLPHAEIAQQIGKTSAATRMLWVRALAALRKLTARSNLGRRG